VEQPQPTAAHVFFAGLRKACPLDFEDGLSHVLCSTQAAARTGRGLMGKVLEEA